MKAFIILITALAISSFSHISGQGELDLDRKAITEHPNFANLEKALTRFVEQRGAADQATLIIPPYSKEGAHLAIFWIEERALFLFTAEFPPEAVEHPVLLSQRFWRLTSDYFYPSDTQDPGHHSSTFMESWDWAKDQVFEAVKHGYILKVVIRKGSEKKSNVAAVEN